MTGMYVERSDTHVSLSQEFNLNIQYTNSYVENKQILREKIKICTIEFQLLCFSPRSYCKPVTTLQTFFACMCQMVTVGIVLKINTTRIHARHYIFSSIPID